jgi:hypothetical protein
MNHGEIVGFLEDFSQPTVLHRRDRVLADTHAQTSTESVLDAVDPG